MVPKQVGRQVPSGFKNINRSLHPTSHLLRGVYTIGPQPFWHQGPVLWKTIFPRTGWAGLVQAVMRAMGSDGERQMKLHLFARGSHPAVRPGS